jgi:sugar lactone lactonase YvrE
MKRTILVTLMMLAIALPTGLATATGHVEWIIKYDPALREFPEGIAVDHHGNIYTSLGPLSQIRKLSPDGSESIFYQFPTGTGLAGLAADVQDNIYVGTVAPGNPDVHGVWRINPKGKAKHLPGTEAMGLPPNGLAFDKRGNLYVTDSWVLGSDPALGSIWRIPPGGEAELWYRDDELLGGLGAIPGYSPIGANGIVFFSGSLYVSNTERGHIVRFPVLPNGEPGEPAIVAQGKELLIIDGLTVDVRGTLYAAIIGQSTIVAVCPLTGKKLVLATAEDGLDNPSSLTFGTGKNRIGTLFFTNYSVLSAEPTPGILKLEMDWPLNR